MTDDRLNVYSTITADKVTVMVDVLIGSYFGYDDSATTAERGI